MDMATEILLSSGHWSGEVVDGYGYISPEATIIANYKVASSFSGKSFNYGFSEGVGLNATFFIKEVI